MVGIFVHVQVPVNRSLLTTLIALQKSVDCRFLVSLKTLLVFILHMPANSAVVHSRFLDVANYNPGFLALVLVLVKPGSKTDADHS